MDQLVYNWVVVLPASLIAAVAALVADTARWLAGRDLGQDAAVELGLASNGLVT